MQLNQAQDPSANSRWRLSSDGKVYARDDEPVAVYFDPSSGDTHLVDEHSAFLLELLMGGPMTVDEIANAIIEASHNTAEEEARDEALFLLRELQTFDIVETA